jgi:hypothetical protein
VYVKLHRGIPPQREEMYPNRNISRVGKTSSKKIPQKQEPPDSIHPISHRVYAYIHRFGDPQIRAPLRCDDGKRAYWLAGGGVLRLVVLAR